MEINDFKQMVGEQNKNTVAIDFDGVLHKNSKGFHDGTIYDEPIVGTKQSLEYLSKGCRLVVYSCKANPNRPLISGRTGIQLIWDWLAEHKLEKYIHDVVYTKPNAICYIDDRGYRFTNWDDALTFVNNLKKEK